MAIAAFSIIAFSSGELGAGLSFSRPSSSTRPLVLPIPASETWYVCQGYDGRVTHEDTPALDLSVDARSAGPRGCMSESRYSSAGSEVTSPAAGTAFRWPGCCGDDFVCINLDSGGSVAIGHLSNRVASGTRVATASRIGAVAWPEPANGNYAHVHVQAHPTPDCTEGSDPVAFDAAHGFKWACTRDLPYSGIVNQYSGMAVTRCSTKAASAPGKAIGDRVDGDRYGPRSASGTRARRGLAMMVENAVRAAWGTLLELTLPFTRP